MKTKTSHTPGPLGTFENNGRDHCNWCGCDIKLSEAASDLLAAAKLSIEVMSKAAMTLEHIGNKETKDYLRSAIVAILTVVKKTEGK